MESSELRELAPASLRFHRAGATLRLTIENECSYLKVSVVRAFPISDAQRHWCVVDAKNANIGIIVSPERLDPENRRLLEEELHRRYMIPVIKRILALTERFGLSNWDVETDRGPCKFMVRNLQESLSRRSPDHVLLTDVEGNRYEFRGISALDAASRQKLGQYL